MASNTDQRVLIHVQHLLGVGHLQRALLLASALRNQGFQVMVVSGGRPSSLTLPQGVRFQQLAPMYSADAGFDQLLDVDGNPIDDNWRNARQQALLRLYHDFAPQVLITETFPFGRRMLRFELLPLLQVSREHSNLVIASIRDILQPRSNPERELETCSWLDTYYDRVLIHGDTRVATLDHSFNHTSRVTERLFYSGYISVQSPAALDGDDGRDEVLVSAGGSATGLHILRTALQARSRSVCSNQRWRLLVSPAIDEDSFAELQGDADDDVIIERNRPDFSALIKRARLSISQAGYNTVTDLLHSSTAAVVIPYADRKEVEQTLRAEALQQRGRVVALAERDLDAATLAAAMQSALLQDADLSVDLDGAKRSARQIGKWLHEAGNRA